MISNLQWLGIYEDAIDRAVETAERAVREYTHRTIQDLWDCAEYTLHECGSFEDITNSIIFALFSTACGFVENEHDDYTVDYYVNCDDSDIIINGECI